MVTEPSPKITENANMTKCENCAFFNPVMAICGQSNKAEFKDDCQSFREKKTIPKTQIPIEILGPVLSHPTEGYMAKIKKVDQTADSGREIARKEEMPRKEESDTQTFKSIFSKLVGSQNDNMEKHEDTMTEQKRSSIFQILGLKGDEAKGQSKDEQKPENALETSSLENKETMENKAESKGRSKSAFELLSQKNNK